MRVRFVSSVLLVAGLLWTIFPVMAQDSGADEKAARWSPDGTQLAFTSNRSGQHALYVVDAAGGEARLLVSDIALWGNFVWSPDGQYIAYERGVWESLDIFMLMVATGEHQPVAENDFANRLLAWSPDGTSLLYHEDQGERIGTVRLYALEDQTSYPLADETLNTFDAVWSSDGKQLAMRGYDAATERYTIYLYDVEHDTLSPDLLVGAEEATGCCNYELAWSPDDTWLAFASRINPYIYGINLATGDIRILVETGVPVQNFAWLADGRLVYLAEWRDSYTLHDHDGSTPPGIYVAYPGEIPQLIAEGVGTWFYLAPDEQYLLLQNIYVGTYQNRNQIRALELINLATYELVEVEVIDTNSYTIAWSPDSTRIAAALCVDGDADIFIIDAVSGNAANLTPDDAFTGDPLPTECGSFG